SAGSCARWIASASRAPAPKGLVGCAASRPAISSGQWARMAAKWGPSWGEWRCVRRGSFTAALRTPALTNRLTARKRYSDAILTTPNSAVADVAPDLQAQQRSLVRGRSTARSSELRLEGPPYHREVPLAGQAPPPPRTG